MKSSATKYFFKIKEFNKNKNQLMEQFIETLYPLPSTYDLISVKKTLSQCKRNKMNYEYIDEDIDNIEWDYLEDKYIDNQGNIYIIIEDIPENYRQYIKPIKPIKPFKVRYVKGVKINSN